MRALSLLGGRRPHVGDAVVGLIVLAAVGESLTVDLPPPRPALLAVYSLSWTITLLARRRFPLGAPLTVVGAFTLESFYLDADDAPVSAIAAVVVGMWSLGLRSDRRRALAGGLLAFAGAQVINRNWSELGVGDVVFTAILVFAPVAAGQVVRARDERLRSLAERARQLAEEREARARAAVAEERTRIARELHDVVGHSISVMTIQAGAARLLLDDDPERAEISLRSVESTGRETLAEMRRLLGVLGDRTGRPVLAPQPGLRELDALVENVRGAGLPVDVAVDGSPGGIAPGVDLTAYRIVQEALTNALRHGGRGSSARVLVRYSEDTLELEILTAGQAATDGASGGGRGLVGMRERIALFGGTLETGAVSPAGYRVRASLPLERTQV